MINWVQLQGLSEVPSRFEVAILIWFNMVLLNTDIQEFYEIIVLDDLKCIDQTSADPVRKWEISCSPVCQVFPVLIYCSFAYKTDIYIFFAHGFRSFYAYYSLLIPCNNYFTTLIEGR